MDCLINQINSVLDNIPLFHYKNGVRQVRKVIIYVNYNSKFLVNFDYDISKDLYVGFVTDCTRMDSYTIVAYKEEDKWIFDDPYVLYRNLTNNND